MPASYSLKDVLVIATRLLPASTTAVTSTAIDTATTPNGVQLADFEFLLSAPLVTTAQLPDTKLFTYTIISSASSNLGSPVTLFTGVLVQTGAGAAGAAAATFRFKLPTTAARYIGFTITPSASGTGDASAATATLEGVF